MSSSTVSLALLGSKKKDNKRKRRPNFRPKARVRGKPSISGSKAPEVDPLHDQITENDVTVTESDKIREAALSDGGDQQRVGSDLLDTATITPRSGDAREPATAEKLQSPALTTGGSQKKKSRKRKSTGVAIGVTRALETGAATEAQALSSAEAVLPAEGDASDAPSRADKVAADAGMATAVETAKIPEDSSGLPALNSFCKVKEKRKVKGDKATTTAATVAAHTVAEEQEPVTAGPTVRIVNGEIVLQKSSMLVNATNKEVEQYPVVEEEAQLAVVGASYTSFVNRKGPQHWLPQETELFYEALRQVGTDFSTMEAYFGTKRTRKQLKRKYQVESAKNPKLIEAALDPKSRKRIDLSVFDVTEADTTEDALAKSRSSLRPESKAPKENSARLGTIDEPIVEDEAESEQRPRSPPQQPESEPTSAKHSVSLWDGDETEEQPESIDPVFDEGEEAETTTLSPLVTRTNNRRKAKPRFRTNRKK